MNNIKMNPISHQRKILVLAGDYSEFLKYRNKTTKPVKYVNHAQALYGMRGWQIVKVGSWRNREDLPECNDLIRKNKMEIVTL